MNPQQQELFDLALLRVLDENRSRFGLTPTACAHQMQTYGFPHPDAALVQDRLEYLTDKGLAEEVGKTIGRANRAWKITEAGLTYADEH